MLSDDGHSAGGRGGGVKATAVRAVGCACAIRASITLLVIGTSIQAPALVGCGDTQKKYNISVRPHYIRTDQKNYRSENKLGYSTIFCQHSVTLTLDNTGLEETEKQCIVGSSISLCTNSQNYD